MNDRAYYAGVDLIRFFAATIVMLFHFSFYSWAKNVHAPLQIDGSEFFSLAQYTWFCAIGVQIFFVISGFVISESAHNAAAIDFIKGRVLRLYPAAWICATATLIIGSLLVGLTTEAVATAYIRSLGLWLWGPWIDPAYWTLPIEICFYGLILLVLSIGQFKRLSWLAAFITCYSGAYALAKFVGYQPHPNRLIAFAQRNALFLLLEHGCFFALGIWFWLAARRRLSVMLAPFAIIAAAGCVLQITNEYEPFLRDYPVVRSYWTGSSVAPISVWLVAVLIIFLSGYFVRVLSPRSARVLRFIRAIGLMTYPLYLLHDVIGVGILNSLISRGISSYPALFAAVATMVGASFIVSTWAEPSLRQLLASVLDRRNRNITPRQRSHSIPSSPGAMARFGGDGSTNHSGAAAEVTH
jgi:exopolysaccharide production protein ExoZ